MALTNHYSSLARPDFLLPEYQFHIQYMEKDIRELL
jgi:hypothetical protein